MQRREATGNAALRGIRDIACIGQNGGQGTELM